MEWIPVDEKAPEVGQTIICAGLRGAMFVGSYCGIEIGGFQRKKHIASLSTGSKDRREIEAWMPAPNPYVNLKKYNEFLEIRRKYVMSHFNMRR